MKLLTSIGQQYQPPLHLHSWNMFSAPGESGFSDFYRFESRRLPQYAEVQVFTSRQGGEPETGVGMVGFLRNLGNDNSDVRILFLFFFRVLSISK